LLDNVDKYYRAGQTTDGNMARAHCMLGIREISVFHHRVSHIGSSVQVRGVDWWYKCYYYLSLQDANDSFTRNVGDQLPTYTA
jgi:hypothetical protein